MRKGMCRKLMKTTEAVSPIIATLMLVLVSVGAAGAFYMWQSGWQSSIEDKAGAGGDIKTSLSIAGSSTVYEFSAVAKEYFEAANPNYRISLQKGGSGAGVMSIGTGVVDIGSASRDLKSSELAKYPDLNGDGNKDYGKELVVTTVAWDAVVPIIPAGNSHGLESINRTTLAAIYAVNGGLYKIDSTHGVFIDEDNDDTYDTGEEIFCAYIKDTGASPDGKINWSEIPKKAGDTTAGNCTGDEEINIYDRAEHSGTEECFTEKLLGKVLGKGQLEEIGITTGNSYESNQRLIEAIAGDPDALGFMSFGIAEESGDVEIVPFTAGSDEPVVPDSSTILSGDYPGARPLNYITIGEPTGDAKVFIDFVMQPENNLNIAHAAGYVSLYD